MSLPRVPALALSVPRNLGYKLVVILATAGLLWFGKSRYDASVVERATQEVTIKRFAHELDSLSKLVVQADKKIQRDTVVLNKAVTRYVTLRDTITVTDTVQVKEALARCDSVVTAVGPTIASLTAGIRTRDATIINRDSTIRVLNARFPTTRQKVFTAAKYVGIGIAIGAVWQNSR